MTRALLEDAVALHRAGNLPAAESRYREVLRKDPNQADALNLLGLIVHEHGDTPGAIALLLRARTQRPKSPDITYNLGKLYLAAGRWNESAEATRAALRLAPTMAAAHSNLAVALLWLGRAQDGEAAARAAIHHDPANAASWSALGLALQHQDKIDGAEAAWRKAIALDADLAEAQANLGALLLSRQNFADGWPLFAARAKADPASFMTGGPMPGLAPVWNGEPLAGKTILVWGEQGLGDQVLFAAMIRDLEQADATIVLACTPRLVTLFSRSFPDVTVVAQNTALPAFTADFEAPLGSLGTYLRRQSGDFPRHAGYLRADPARTAALRARYRAQHPGALIVGISWRSAHLAAGGFKSTTLAAWEPLLRVPGAVFISLQYGDTAAALGDAARRGLPVSIDSTVDPDQDIDGLVSQIAATDLVISVSNTTVHLAGAANCPVWTLAPSGAGRMWYWFGAGAQESPWYPAMRLYHQPKPGDWAAVIAQVANDLAGLKPGL